MSYITKSMSLNSKLSLADNAFVSFIIRSRDVELETTAHSWRNCQICISKQKVKNCTQRMNKKKRKTTQSLNPSQFEFKYLRRKIETSTRFSTRRNSSQTNSRNMKYYCQCSMSLWVVRHREKLQPQQHLIVMNQWKKSLVKNSTWLKAYIGVYSISTISRGARFDFWMINECVTRYNTST